MSNDELTHKLIVLMQKHDTHLQAAIEAVQKLGNANNTLSEFMKYIPTLPKPIYAELMANAVRHDNARDQLLEAWELMKEDFRELMQAMLEATK